MVLIICVMASFIFFCFMIATITCINISFLKTGMKKTSDDKNTTDILFNIVNQLIGSLTTADEFKDNVNMKSMLLMHNDVRKIAENYSEMFEVIKMWSKADLYDEVIKDILNFNEVFDEVLRDRYKSFVYYPLSTNFSFLSEYEGAKALRIHDKRKKNERIVSEKNNKITSNGILQSRGIKRRNWNRRRKYRNLKVWQVTNRSSDIENARRLYGGVKTSAREHPFIASVHVDNTFMCGASIIARFFVITAATCLQNNIQSSKQSQIIFVRIGSDYATHEGELLKVVTVTVHPEYDVMTLKNNLAILKLEHKMQKRQKNRVRRIKFDRVPMQIPVKVDHVTVLGWGATYPNDDLYETRRLSSSRLNMYHIKDCQSLYNEKYVTLKNFCAGFISKGGGACNRDLGGPGIENGVLIGVISFGAPVCGTPDAPTVFTKLGYYANWIDSVIEQVESNEAVENEKVYNDKDPNYGYFREDQTDQYVSTTTTSPVILRLGSNKESSQESDILNSMSNILPLNEKIEVPKFLIDLYEGLPKNLINLFATVSIQTVINETDSQESLSEKLTTNTEQIRDWESSFEQQDTTTDPKLTEGITKFLGTDENLLSQLNHGKVTPTASSNEVINVELDNNSEVSDNYENNSVDKDFIEIGFSIYENSSEKEYHPRNEIVYFDKFRRNYGRKLS